MSWIGCVVDSDYEIFTEFPYQIRRKGSDKIIKEYIDRGYYNCMLNNKKYRKHRIIALQFIQNDDPINKNQVDHIDHNKLNNDISNLRWVNNSENQKNKSCYKNNIYEYVDNIDEECILVDTYNNHTFEDYYYDAKTDTFYFYNGLKYRKLKIQYMKNKYAYVNMRDIDKNHVRILYSKFKKQYDII